MEKEIREIARLIEQLRIEDSNLRVFGADNHKYRIGPKLSEKEVINFEREHGIVLPPDYRLWLQIVGDGSGVDWDMNGIYGPLAGVGPDYGIYNLRDTTIESRPGKPFKSFLVRYEGHDSETLVCETDEDDNILGVLEMGTKGCDTSTYLVVNGTDYGTIWLRWNGDFQATNITFSQWVRKWVEYALACVVNERIADSIKVGMTRTQVIEICGDALAETSLAGMRYLRFKNFATTFHLDENDRVDEIRRNIISYHL